MFKLLGNVTNSVRILFLLSFVILVSGASAYETGELSDVSIIVSEALINVPEGDFKIIYVSLSQAPEGNLTVSARIESLGQDLAIIFGDTLVFDNTNYSSGKTVIISAEEDDDDFLDSSAMLLLESEQCDTVEINVTAVDNDEYVPGTVVQWSEGAGGNGHYYLAVAAPNGISWQCANSAAIEAGGHLVSITSEQENDFVYMISDYDMYWTEWLIDVDVHFAGPWLGGYQINKNNEPGGSWTWVDGSPWTYSRWHGVEPNNLLNVEDYLQFMCVGYRAAYWNDAENIVDLVYAGDVVGYIIEFESKPSAFDTVVFTDPNLKAAVEEQLGVISPNVIDIMALATLDAVGRNISELAGLQYAKNLEYLNLSGNNVASLEPIGGLTSLQTLWVDGNELSDLSPLQSFTDLRYLHAEYNHITDISILSGLTRLEVLGISDNEIADISVIANYPVLNTLMIDSNPITDTSVLDTCDSLILLNACNITNLDPGLLYYMGNMQFLYIGNCGVSDISFVSNMPRLAGVVLNNNEIIDISLLASCDRLENVYLQNNNISNIQPITTQTGLVNVDITNNPLSNVSHCYYIPAIEAHNSSLESFYYDSCQCSCNTSADISGDGNIDIADFSMLAAEWMNNACSGTDITGDCNIDIADIEVMASQWLALADNANIIGYWPLNTDTQDVVNGNAAVLHGDAYIDDYYIPAVLGGGAVSLDGEGDYIELDGCYGVGGSASRTCMAWVKTNVNEQLGILTWGQASAGEAWLFRVESDGRLGVGIFGGYISTINKIDDDQWHHVAAILNGSDNATVKDIILLVDGVVQGVTFAGEQVINTNASRNVLAGAIYVNDVPGKFLPGMIDDIKIYERALSIDEIKKIVKKDVLLYLSCDEKDGNTFEDGSIYQRLCYAYNGANSDPGGDGVINSSLLLDGINDYVFCMSYKGITGTQDRTCSMWIKTETPGKHILSWGSTDIGAKWLVRLNGDSNLRVEVSGGYISGTRNLADGQWHHVAVVFADDGSPNVEDVLMYIDGSLEIAGACAPCDISTAEGDNVTIGMFSAGRQYFNGNIDELYIFDRALPENEIQNLYNLSY